MQINPRPSKVLNKLVHLGGRYMNGLTSRLITTRHLFAIALVKGEEEVVAIPIKGGKPLTLQVKSGESYAVTSGAVSCFSPRLDVPGTNRVKELQWLNQLNQRKGRDIHFQALIDIADDTFEPI